MQYNEIIDNLQNLINYKPKQREIGEILGLRTSVIGQRSSRGSHFSVEEIKKIGDHYGVNLFTNELQNSWGELEEKNHYEILNSIAKEEIAHRIQLTTDEIICDYYTDTFGSCGNGIFTFSNIREKMLVPKKIVDSYSQQKTYSVINAYGDSMAPYIMDKDLLVVEQYDGEQVRDDRIYVFTYDDKIFIKRLVLNINQLFIKSDNPMYNPIVIDLKENPDVHIIGKVAGVMRKVD